MNFLIQYQQADQSWSPWTPCRLEGTKLMVNGEELKFSPVRVLKNENPENPDVCWYVWHEQILYEIKSVRGFIEKAIPLPNQEKKDPIAVKKIPGNFSIDEFQEMNMSAKDHLKPPLFTLEFLQESLIRAADNTQNMALAGIETPEQQAQNWWKDLYERYRQDVEAQLIQIIQDNPTQRQQIESLSEFLKAHYQFIQGTCLDYVAIPHHPVTTTLTRMAEILERETQIPAIQLLMPGIATESIKDGYEDLTILPIPLILQSHIALKEHYLTPVRSLIDYVESPNETCYSPYTLEDYRPQALLPSDIQVLFQHSSTTHELHDAFRTYQGLITQESNLLGQLNILGKKLQLYDAHGGIGRSDSAAGWAYPAIMDFMQYYLSLEPCALIISETPPTIADLPEGHSIAYIFYQDQIYFINANEQTVQLIETPEYSKFDIHLGRFKQLSDIPEDLPQPAIIKTDDGQFTFFPGSFQLTTGMISCINDNFPSKYHHIINFRDANIPKVVFDAIGQTTFQGPRFIDLFHQQFKKNKTLSPEDLAWIDVHTEHSFMNGYTKVPKALRDEIELLWQLFHNPAKNIEATRNMATCIGTRGTAIRSLTKQHEAALIEISTSPERQHLLLDEARKHLQSRIHELQTQLDTQTYEGQDHHLSLNLDILTRLGKSITIQSLADVYKLNLFAPKDLIVLLDSNPELLESLKNQLSVSENFVMYLTDSPDHILEVILPCITDHLKSCIQKFPAMVEMLTPNKIDMIMTELKKSITNEKVFLIIYNALPPVHQAELISSFQGQFIRTLNQFLFLYENLSPEHQNLFFNSVQGRLPEFINSVFLFYSLYEKLSPEHQNLLLFNSVQGRLPEFINSVFLFYSLYEKLSPEHQNLFFRSALGRLPKFIHPDVFLLFYEKISPEHQKLFFNSILGQEPEFFHNRREFLYLYEKLSPKSQNQVMMLLLQHQLDGRQPIQTTINQLLHEKPDSLWSSPLFKHHLERLDTGIKELQKICSSQSIENFLQALLSQNQEQIIKALQALEKSKKKPMFSFFNSSRQPEIYAILRTHFFPHPKPDDLQPIDSIIKQFKRGI